MTSLSEAARRLQQILGEHAVVIGGICGAIHGVERFTHDVDFATDLEPERVLELLEQAGIEASSKTAAEPDELPWVVTGMLDEIPFQILPAASTQIDVTRAETKAALRVPDIRAFITSKCIAGGQQDLHDVAVLCLLDAERTEFARATAEAHGCTDKLEAWLTDRRLRRRYDETD